MSSYHILKQIRLVCGLPYDRVSMETGLLVSHLQEIEHGSCSISPKLTPYYAAQMRVSSSLLNAILDASDGRLGFFCQRLSRFYSFYLSCVLKLRGNDE
jgi:hypothetical protein